MRTEMRSPRAVVLWHSSRHALWAFTVLAMTTLFLLLSDRGAVLLGTDEVVTEGACLREDDGGAVADFGVGSTVALLEGLAGT